MAGEILVKGGYVDREYIAMIEREDDLATYIGKGIAFLHGVGNAKKNIRKSGMVVLKFPDGIAFGNDTVYLVIGIAGIGNEHLGILSNIATVIDEEDAKTIEPLFNTKDVDINPIIIGHEMAGNIIKVGSKWEDSFKAGNKFAIQPALNYKGSMDSPGYSYKYCGGAATYAIRSQEVMELGCLLNYEGEAYYEASLAEPMFCIICQYKTLERLCKIFDGVSWR